MSLFDALDQTPQELLPRDGSALLYPGALELREAQRVFERLLAEVAWQAHDIHVYGRVIPQPRLMAWFGDPGSEYRYSGLHLVPEPWTPLVAALRDRCQRLAGTRFNSVLVNLYRDGQDSVSWHSDDEPVLGPDPTIASMSLGAERRFDLRHKRSRETIRTVLPAGSVLVMSGACQRCWSHQVPKTKRVTQPRVNLTFRRIVATESP